jgi:hypothetical protein
VRSQLNARSLARLPTSTHTTLPSAPPRSHPPLAWRAARGALFGALLGVVFIGIGALRAMVALLSGTRIQALTAADVRPLVFYIGGFGAAGALLGATRPLLRTRAATYAGFAIGGAIVMIAIMAGDEGGLASINPTEWVVIPLAGALLGCAFARGWLARPR